MTDIEVSTKVDIQDKQTKNDQKDYQEKGNVIQLQDRKSKREKVNKGEWRMPRLLEAMKDVVSCEKSRGFANKIRSANIRMGQPSTARCYSVRRANPGN